MRPPASGSTDNKTKTRRNQKTSNTLQGDETMQDFPRRALLQGGTALTAAGMLTGPALFDFAKAWAQSAPFKAEPGAKLTLMRWKRFVPSEDAAFMDIVAAFKAA